MNKDSAAWDITCLRYDISYSIMFYNFILYIKDCQSVLIYITILYTISTRRLQSFTRPDTSIIRLLAKNPYDIIQQISQIRYFDLI